MAVTGFEDLGSLQNRNEALVWAAIEDHLAADESACRCRDCILDMAAIALNRLPPRYEVYSFHKQGPARDAGHEKQVREAVAAAASQVAKRPHHL
jgi:competence protein ComFB